MNVKAIKVGGPSADRLSKDSVDEMATSRDNEHAAT
jgi:hypothetical protein